MGVKVLSAVEANVLRALALHSAMRDGYQCSLGGLGIVTKTHRAAMLRLRDRGIVRLNIAEGGLKLWSFTAWGLELIRLAWPPDGEPKD